MPEQREMDRPLSRICLENKALIPGQASPWWETKAAEQGKSARKSVNGSSEWCNNTGHFSCIFPRPQNSKLSPICRWETEVLRGTVKC